jgi:4-carboxymuconolactone decarboxylase
MQEAAVRVDGQALGRQDREETYRKAAAELGDRGVVDLVGVLGYYGLVSMTIAAFKVLPDGQDPFA